MALLLSASAFPQQPPVGPETPRLQPGQLPPAQPGQPAVKSDKAEQDRNQASPAPAASTDSPAPADSSDPNRIVVTTRNILVPTVVKDRDTGGYINGLTIQDFKVFDNNKEQKISSDFSYQPLSIVAVVQRNSDVEPMIPKIRLLGTLLQGLISGATGDVSIIAYDHRINVLQDWTSDPDRLDDVMQKVTSGSSTARTIDAVLEADRLLKRHDPQNRRRRIVLLFSQGYDKGSESKEEETLRQMQFDSVIVYAINMSKLANAVMKGDNRYPRKPMGGVPPEAMGNSRGNTMTDTQVLQNHPGGNVLNLAPPVWRSVKDLFKLPPDEAFTRMTGGRMYSFARQSTLEAAMTDLGKELHSQYVLSYSPNNTNEPGFHQIRVDVNHPRLEIRSRTGYYWGGGVQ
jgi:VWFA-related protein